jgi:aminocarboxymuconate-semialdehyde decarboxylase
MPRIDIHTHILPPKIPAFKDKFGYGGFIRLDPCGEHKARMMRDDGTFFRDIESNCWDPERRLEEMMSAKVFVQVLSTVPVMFSYWTRPQDGYDIARYLNDHIAGIVEKHPNHFVGLGTLPLQAPDLAIKELERCHKSLKLRGVQIGTHVNGVNLDDPKLFPVFEAIATLGLALFVHPWDMMGGERMQKFWLPWLLGMPMELAHAIASLSFGGVFERLPNLRVAFAHGGGAYGMLAGRMGRGFEARPDLCATENRVNPREYLGRFYVDSLVHDARTLQFLLDMFGPDRVALGSDYPFPLGEDRPGQLIESLEGVEDKLKDRLLGGNALDWLGMSETDFWQ